MVSITGARDGNDEVVEDWVEETTSAERVRSFMRRTYEGESVEEVAERARVDISDAREHLDGLVDEGFVETESQDDALYKRSPDSLADENKLGNDMVRVEDYRDDLDYRDGEAHCPVDGCEWWVPEGMEYAYAEHVDEHDD